MRHAFGIVVSAIIAMMFFEYAKCVGVCVLISVMIIASLCIWGLWRQNVVISFSNVKLCVCFSLFVCALISTLSFVLSSFHRQSGPRSIIKAFIQANKVLQRRNKVGYNIVDIFKREDEGLTEWEFLAIKNNSAQCGRIKRIGGSFERGFWQLFALDSACVETGGLSSTYCPTERIFQEGRDYGKVSRAYWDPVLKKWQYVTFEEKR